MKASDVMVSPVITVKSGTSVKGTAKLLLEHRISAEPVVDDQGRLVGIVSEGDLIRRSEIGTERKRSWWLLMVSGNEALAAEYICRPPDSRHRCMVKSRVGFPHRSASVRGKASGSESRRSRRSGQVRRRT